LDWLLLAGLGIIWAAFLLPTGSRRQHSPNTSVEEFEKNMDLLADTERTNEQGRWVITPKKGTAFLGPRERERARTRMRRRHVLTFLMEATGITFLIGLFPPLHGMWLLAGMFGLALAGYVALLIRLKEIESGKARGHDRVRAAQDPSPARYQSVARSGGYATGTRYVAEGTSSPRVSYAGLSAAATDDESVHVIVHDVQPV
jgi:uncharacterized iron-regulated membrane protein